MSTELSQAIRGRFDQTVTELTELVRIPGVAYPSFDPAELDRSAEKVRALITARGFDEVQILRATYDDGEGASATGAPAVVARRLAKNGAPTILLYAHHDVQPPGEPADWQSPAFEPTQRGDRLYGRGCADDKAGIMTHLAAISAVDEVLGESGTPGTGDLGVTLFFEGEEEAGSPSFAAFLAEHQELLRAEVIVVADSANWKIGTPALTTSLRGLLDGWIELEVLNHNVHSGMFGGPILDAPTQLSRLIASFHDSAGSVAIAGLTRGPEPEIDYPEADFRQDASLLEGLALSGVGSITSRLWAQPALSIIGMDVPATVTSSNTITASARARFSLRLAPGQDLDQAWTAVEQHIAANTPETARVKLIRGEQGKPYAANIDAPASQQMLAALAQAWGTTPVLSGLGGSIPFIAELEHQYPEAQILITGVEDPDSRAHGTNESLHLGEFEKCILAEALFLAGMIKP